ncbi:MAG: YCF48-related protein [bacterium]|nr:YCF48-related protein [bacterium]
MMKKMKKVYIAGVLIFVCINCISAQNQWYKQNSGVTSNFLDMSFVDTLNGWVIGGWPAYHTSDGGRHWEAQFPVDSPYGGGECIGFKDSLEGWVGGGDVTNGSGTLLYHTTDGGKHWEGKKGKTIQVDWVDDIDIRDSTVGFVLGEHTDWCSTWYSWISPLFGTNMNAFSLPEFGGHEIHFVDSLHGWVMGYYNSAHLYYTNTGPNGLKMIDSSFDVNSFYFSDTLNGWAVKNSGVILHSEDGGKIWNTQTSGVNDTLTCVDFIDSLNGWIVGTGGCILRTRDGGKHWDTESSPTIENLRKVQFIDSSHGWAAGDSGTILYYGPFQGIEKKSPPPRRGVATLQISQNPFVEKTVVSGFTSGGSEKSKIRIYDISGKLIEETKNNIITAKAGCSIGKNLKPGIYFVKVNDYKPLKIVKMKKIK